MKQPVATVLFALTGVCIFTAYAAFTYTTVIDALDRAGPAHAVMAGGILSAIFTAAAFTAATLLEDSQ